ncbi:MAG: hypothetical protein DI606_04240 [Sphingobium sp.]|nr:MAG: hypothetical protein DI606_04240 [Sphingobium sp.]
MGQARPRSAKIAFCHEIGKRFHNPRERGINPLVLSHWWAPSFKVGALPPIVHFAGRERRCCAPGKDASPGLASWRSSRRSARRRCRCGVC